MGIACVAGGSVVASNDKAARVLEISHAPQQLNRQLRRRDGKRFTTKELIFLLRPCLQGGRVTLVVGLP